ncbi:MAG: hydroxyisourate hydrolase [Rubrimonas sp.]|uniref:hydroxyisourate hydrolase n=1 Tax=Rubrimonas sp. TaxID=2036015 RepID=UPI002FDCC5BE
MGRITTHVLDTATGRPAAGLDLALFRIGADGARAALGCGRTNADGRLDAPILEGAALVAGTYELEFHAGAYLRAQGNALPEPLFLDVIPLRFGVSDPDAHHHVPLLLSPFGYSTYRGS